MQAPYQEKMGPAQVPATGAQPAQAYAGAQKLPSKWTFGLFDCFAPIDLCLLTTFCPCVTFGRTHAREGGEQNPSGMNGMCAAYCVLAYCGGGPILQCMNRTNIKQRYGMEENCVNDCLISWCCHCCALVQEEKESLVRQTGVDPKTKQPYQPVGGMNYA